MLAFSLQNITVLFLADSLRTWCFAYALLVGSMMVRPAVCAAALVLLCGSLLAAAAHRPASGTLSGNHAPESKVIYCVFTALRSAADMEPTKSAPLEGRALAESSVLGLLHDAESAHLSFVTSDVCLNLLT